jgi:hypothetical protein
MLDDLVSQPRFKSGGADDRTGDSLPTAGRDHWTDLNLNLNI